MSSRINANFETVLEKVARIMARNYGVDVRIEGNMAMTDGKTIYLPVLEDVEEELMADLNSFLDHEVAHVKFTEFPEMNRCLNRFHRELLNAVEDSRIEILLPKEYPGTALNLERLNEKWGAKVNANRAKMPWPIRIILAIRDVYDRKHPVIDEQIEPIMDAILPQAEKLRTLDSTNKLRKATEQIIHDINAAREKLAAGLPPLTDEQMEALQNLKQTGETPIALDPDRKEKDPKGKKTASKEQELDPSVEEKKNKKNQMSGSGDEEGEESDSQDASAEGEGDKSKDKAQNEKSDKSKAGKEAGDDESTDKADGKSGAGSDEQGEDEAEGGDNGEFDAEAEDEEGAGESGSSDSQESAEGKPSQNQDKKSGEEFDGTQEIEERKNYAKWQESETEKQMMKEKDGAEDSEFDKHIHSSESYMEQQVSKEIERQPKVDRHRGYYYGKENMPEALSLPFSTAHDEIIDYSGKGDRDAYAEKKRKVMPLINPTKIELERVLKVKENAKYKFNRERGSLNTRSLSQLAINPSFREPFKEFTKTDTSDVAVTLLIDCSGSMSGDKIEVARQTALAIGESLKAININFEILGFTTTSNHSLASKVGGLSSGDVERFNRFGEALRLMVFKSFDCPSLAGITECHAGNSNCDGESVIWASKRLALRKEKRKILLVLSDGQPAVGGSNHMILAGDLKRVVRLLPKAGIEVIGFGILTEDVKIFYPEHVIVDDLKKLPTTVMRKVAKMLEKGMK
jgi:cobalamin biosynthesis protein CobT